MNEELEITIDDQNVVTIGGPCGRVVIQPHQLLKLAGELIDLGLMMRERRAVKIFNEV